MSVTPVAIIQAEPSPGIDDALVRTRALAREAAEGGARLVVFPETWIPGYPAWIDYCRDAALWSHPPSKAAYRAIAENSVAVEGDSGRRLQAIAREVEVTLVVGISERVERGPGRNTLYNAIVTLGPDGAILNHHRKLVPTFTEKLIWGPGDADGLQAVDTPAGRVGSLVCWEHWMPLPRQAMHDSGEDIHVAIWPTVHEDHQLGSRHYAFEGRCFVLAAGCLLRARDLPPGLEPHPGTPDDWILRGGSAVIGPDGRYVCEPVFDRETIVRAELDTGRNREEAMNLDVSGHYARPELFDLDIVRQGRSVRFPPPARTTSE